MGSIEIAEINLDNVFPNEKKIALFPFFKC